MSEINYEALYEQEKDIVNMLKNQLADEKTKYRNLLVALHHGAMKEPGEILSLLRKGGWSNDGIPFLKDFKLSGGFEFGEGGSNEG